MPSNLGLVCITHSDDVRYRTVTRKRLLLHGEAQQRDLLRELYHANLGRLSRALDFCQAERIALYRLPSGIFPFFDEDVGRAVMTGLEDEAGRLGVRAAECAIRLVMHPDQFVVLSSDSDAVVANSIKILRMHGDIMDLLRQPRSPWALLEIHGGKAGRAERLIAAIRALPAPIRLRLALENDEYAYGAEEIWRICMAAGVPMVFDAHHHVIYEGLDSYDHPSVAAMLAKAAMTWADPAQQLVHISNGREAFGDRSHADLITAMPACYGRAPWIEIEAKHKEQAIRLLRRGNGAAGA